MKNTGKKILGIVAAATIFSSVISFAACGDTSYKGDALDGYTSEAQVTSNGGFVVEKGDYVYFINGAQDYTADNTYGDVVKGALVRISKADLAAKNYDAVKTVVPSLLVAQDYDSGIYIYGDYVYYATPTTDKSMGGDVQNSWIDFKRAKIDGSEAPMDGHFFRLSNNAANYRFVEVDGAVYCLYEEDSALKSYNCTANTGKATVLVKGAKSAFFYDMKDLTNPNVYYTMGVTNNADSEHSTTALYDQLYCVNAATTVSKVDKANAAYTVGDKTYDFDEDFLKKQNEEAKKNDLDEPYDFGDYTTYPYVNLGDLVLDGIGLNSKYDAKFNEGKQEDAFTPDGYTYTISSYQNGGVYFTRAEVNKTASTTEGAKLYYLADADSAADWDSIAGNKSEKLDVVALDTTNASASAIFLYDEETGAHEYIYLSSDTLYKASAPVNGVSEVVTMAYKLTGATLWTVNGDYLYYYATGTNGNNVSRINYTGTKEDYNPLLNKEEYQPITLALVDWNSAWYKPEIVDDTLLYSNAQSFGTSAYNYIYAAKLGATADIKAVNEAYEAVREEIDSYSGSNALQTALNYYFRTGARTYFDNVKSLYSEYQVTEFDAFVEKVANEEFKLENSFIARVGKMNAEDSEAIEEAWVASLLSETEEEEDKSLPGWAIALIVVGCVVVVAGAVVAVLLVCKKKKAQKEEADATVNAYKRKKIDTTDDKSIDVYADDEATETEEAAEEETEEVVEEVVEEVAEEATEAAAEETTEEVAEEAAEENND